MNDEHIDSTERSSLSLDPDFIRRKVSSPKVIKTSFTLTPHAARVLEAIWEQAGITAREIFDQALEKPWYLNSDWLSGLSEKIRNREISEKRSIRKTLALSERSCLELEKVSKSNKIRRDDLACAVIEQFLTSYNERINEAKNKWEGVMTFIESIAQLLDVIEACAYKDRETNTIHLATEIVSWPWGGKVKLDPSRIPYQWHGTITGLLERTTMDLKDALLSMWYDDEKFYNMAESSMVEDSEVPLDEDNRRFRTMRDIALHFKPINLEGDQS